MSYRRYNGGQETSTRDKQQHEKEQVTVDSRMIICSSS